MCGTNLRRSNCNWHSFCGGKVIADPEIIEDYIKNYGCEKIMFGSDFPFGSPQEELEKVLRLDIPEKAKEKITSLNILSMLRLLVKNIKP